MKNVLNNELFFFIQVPFCCNLNVKLVSLRMVILGSSLFYNTSARLERHECGTNDKGSTRVLNEEYERDE